jgi:SprB repeat
MKKIFLFIFILFSINIHSQMNLTVSPSPSCTGGFGAATIVINGGNGPYNYVLSKNNVVYLSGSISTTVYTFANLSAAVYTVAITDANTATASVNFTIASQLIPTWTWTNTTCYGSNDGALFINASGGTAPYTYSLSNGTSPSSNNVYNNLASGIYQLKVTDSYGCVSQNTVTISSPDRLTSLINVMGQTITINTTGGVTPYLYSIDGIIYQTGNVFNNLPTGTYNVSVRDTNGCITVNPITIVNSPPLSITASINNPSCSGYGGSIVLNVTGGQGAYQYNIDGGAYQISNVFVNVLSGNHILNVKDAIGNTMSISITVVSPPALAATTATANLSATIIVSGGTPPYLYSANGTIYTIDNTFTFTSPGNATLYAKDANGCIINSTALLYVAAPLINGSSTASITLGAGSTLANVVVQGNNITWYSAPGTLRNASNKTITETPLPLNTILVNGTTYYASQTINGFESQQRLAVTVTLTPLSVQDFIFNNFKYYPNPVKDSFSLSNATVIDHVFISNILGEIILTKIINRGISV